MSVKYADIIIDISQTNVDRPFEYSVPEELMDSIGIGSVVKVPFGNGNRVRTGYVIGLKDEPIYDKDKIKSIKEVSEKAISIESRLIKLAEWMKDRYGSTLINALMTVMPVKEKVRERKTGIDIRENIPEFRPIEQLEPGQQAVVDDFISGLDRDEETCRVSLLHGITGSGKTEVYIRMAEEVIKRGQDVIVLVPEIALTYQTVARFSSYFQDSICILNSQLSKGEKYREFMKAMKGETHIMIGPRSALFAPFRNLGLIIIDEEHDTSYKSEMSPKYHAREVAEKRAELEGARVILGSATPAIESYHKALSGEYKLYELTDRVKGATLPDVEIVDLRDELAKGNRSIISESLYNKLRAAFDRKEQAMLFINRRGFNTFVSCRSCGEAIKCPNCDVSLALHGRDTLMCHYCGYEEKMPHECPKCKSKLIGGYGTGTEKLEAEINKLFPDIKTLRMDRDTTTGKGSHGAIIKKFRDGEADCLVGTQMIVKGHDFPRVSVVGSVLADLSLFDTDYESAERTYDLLTQASGRAGRDEVPGHVVIQTYQPDHYAIAAAAVQDYKGFYEYEIAYRKMLHYPPFYHMLAVLVSSDVEAEAESMSGEIAEAIKQYVSRDENRDKNVDIVGPAQAFIYRINNIYRKVIYIKAEDYDILTDVSALSDALYEKHMEIIPAQCSLEIQYDFNPMRII